LKFAKQVGNLPYKCPQEAYDPGQKNYFTAILADPCMFTSVLLNFFSALLLTLYLFILHMISSVANLTRLLNPHLILANRFLPVSANSFQGVCSLIKA
jgi:hypothetical protein